MNLPLPAIYVNSNKRDLQFIIMWTCHPEMAIATACLWCIHLSPPVYRNKFCTISLLSDTWACSRRELSSTTDVPRKGCSASFSVLQFVILVAYLKKKKLIMLNNTTSDNVFLVFSGSVQWIQVLACLILFFLDYLKGLNCLPWSCDSEWTPKHYQTIEDRLT